MNLQRVCHSNIGKQSDNSGYQITAKSDELSYQQLDTFTQIASSVRNMPGGVNYTEGILAKNETIYFYSVSMYVSEDGKPAPITSAIVVEGNDWRELMKDPAKVYTCSRDYFYESTPAGALPGNPVALTAISTLQGNGKQLSVDAVCRKYQINKEKYAALMRCVYHCMLARTRESMMIGLPKDLLNPENFREIMFLISKALPPVMRAQLTYRFATVGIGTIVNFGPSSVLGTAQNYIDLTPTDSEEITYKISGNEKAMEPFGRLVSQAGNEAFFDRMNEFILEDGQFANGGRSVDFDQPVVKYGKQNLLSGAVIYAAGKTDGMYSSSGENDVDAILTLLSLFMMARPRTSAEEKRVAWDRVTGQLLSEYTERILQTSLSSDVIQFDKNAVHHAIDRGQRTLSYPGSPLTKAFMDFAKDYPAIYEDKCLAEQRIESYTVLLNEIYKSQPETFFEQWEPKKWYLLREKYADTTSANRALVLTLVAAFQKMSAAARQRIIAAADFNDRELIGEFLHYPNAALDLDLGDEFLLTVYQKICQSQKERLCDILDSEHFCSLRTETVETFLKDTCRDLNDESVLVLLETKALKCLNSEQIKALYELVLSQNRDRKKFVLHPSFTKLLNVQQQEVICGELFREQKVNFAEMKDILSARFIQLFDARTRSELISVYASVLLKMILGGERPVGELISLLEKTMLPENMAYDLLLQLVGGTSESARQSLIPSLFQTQVFAKLSQEHKNDLYQEFLTDQVTDELACDLVTKTNLLGCNQNQQAEILRKLAGRSTNLARQMLKTDVFTKLEPINKQELFAKAIDIDRELAVALIEDQSDASILKTFSQHENVRMEYLMQVLRKVSGNEELILGVYRSPLFVAASRESKYTLYDAYLNRTSAPELLLRFIQETDLQGTTSEDRIRLLDKVEGKWKNVLKFGNESMLEKFEKSLPNEYAETCRNIYWSTATGEAISPSKAEFYRTHSCKKYSNLAIEVYEIASGLDKLAQNRVPEASAALDAYILGQTRMVDGVYIVGNSDIQRDILANLRVIDQNPEERRKLRYSIQLDQILEKDKVHRKKGKKILLVSSAVVLVAVILAGTFAYFKVITPKKAYNAADELMKAGQYEEALEAFELLGDYKDAEKKAEICQNEWDRILEEENQRRKQEEDAARYAEKQESVQHEEPVTLPESAILTERYFNTVLD